MVGDSVQDVIILQSESKIKAALGKNVKISLPKAYPINQKQNKCLAVKGVPTDITEAEFQEFLDLNKISYAKAERLKSKKDGRVLPIFQLEINDPAEAEALLSQNLVCNVTGIVYKVEEFRQPVSVRQCFNCQSFGYSAKNCRSKPKCVVRAIRIRDGRKKKQNSQSVQTVQDHMLHPTTGVPNTKKQAFRQHVVNHQKPMPQLYSKNLSPSLITHKRFNSPPNS